MPDETTTDTPAETATADETTTTETEDQRVPYERFQKANKDAKDAKDRAKALEKQLAEIQAQIDEREQQGLPELEQLRKRLDAAEKRATEADSRAEAADQRVQLTQRERWVTQAANKLNFIDPDDAARYVDLAEIEDADQAERAVKRVAKAKEHLIRNEDPKLPGRVLENGRPATPADAAKKGAIDAEAEARTIATALKQFTQNWTTVE